jgi:hypothetical protein
MGNIAGRGIFVQKELIPVYNRGFSECLQKFKQASLNGSLEICLGKS